MLTSYYAMLALDVANERSREVAELRLARLARESLGDGAGYDWLPAPTSAPGLRSGLARATAAISLGAAAATRRLDERKGNDLSRKLALTD
jgi:hypothetical protein